LGQTTVICTDKTGTLTQNNMTVQYLATSVNTYHIGDTDRIPESNILPVLLRTGALCTNARIGTATEAAVGDPTEVALLASCQAYADGAELLTDWKRLDELAFDSERKSMSTIDSHAVHGTVVHTKGALERILAVSTHILTPKGNKKLTQKDRDSIILQSEAFAAQGMRVLACAIKPWKQNAEVTIDTVESDMVFVGMQAMIDPPHEGVPDAITKCHTAGIRVIMITGDNPVTAAAIAAQVGITGETMLGDTFMELSEAEQKEAVQKVGVFSRVAPAHKFHIVSVLQDLGETVAMTGDGVNDAPAIKKADFGIAMGINGTDISKQASDMILLDDNFATIVSAIEEGRTIYQNIRKVINFLLSSNTAEVLIIMLAILFGWSLPLTAIMILWINLVTDGLPALTLSLDPIDPNSMKRPPKSKEESFITKHMVFTMGITVVLITAIVLAVFYFAQQYNAHLGSDAALKYAQTMAFTTLIFLEIVRITILRSEQKLGFFSNYWLVAAIVFTFFLHLMVLYTPMNQFLNVVPLGVYDWIALIIIRFVMIWLSRYIPVCVQLLTRKRLAV
jgi:Ca2+-transporting ATPase